MVGNIKESSEAESTQYEAAMTGQLVRLNRTSCFHLKEAPTNVAHLYASVWLSSDHRNPSLIVDKQSMVMSDLFR